MPYHAYQVLQVERPKTEAERRAADQRLGEMVAAAAQLADDLARPARALRRLLRRVGTPGREHPARPASDAPVGERYV
jgi:putative heme degradation protein